MEQHNLETASASIQSRTLGILLTPWDSLQSQDLGGMWGWASRVWRGVIAQKL